MAIPEKALEVTLDPDEITLGELMLFEPGGFTIGGFVEFISDNTNWTLEEAKGLKVKEMKQVTEMLREALQGVSVPLAS